MRKMMVMALASMFALGLGLNAYGQTSTQSRDMNQSQSSQGYTDRRDVDQNQPTTTEKRDMDRHNARDNKILEPFANFRGEFKGSSLIGAKVENSNGDNLGKISDLAVDPRTNHVDFAVLSHGGALGMGDKYVAIPLSAFSVKMDKNGKLDKLVLDTSKDKLAQAPSFDKDHWPNRAQAEQSYRYFGQTPSWHGKTESKSMDRGTKY